MNPKDFFETSETDVIQNSKPNHLYSHEFEKGRFFQVVHEDNDGSEVKLAPRTMFKVVYIKEKDDIEGIEFIKLINGSEKQKVSFSKFNLAQLKAFLSFISEIDLKGVTEKRLKIYDDQDLDSETIKTIKTLLTKDGGAEIIEKLIDDGAITSKDIVNTSFRKKGLKIFSNMIKHIEYWKQYAKDNKINASKEEKVWQYFLEQNEWIFGYGLDYRYQQILQREPHVSNTDLDGSNTVIADYLMGDTMFTTFVELKKPSTKIFSNGKNRSGSWRLSNDLIDSVSQILEQKASGQIKLDDAQYINGEPLQQKSYDSKVILIIGCWSELDGLSSQEKEIKKKTFELFRRDSRNIEILTFDELYNRAQFIVGDYQDDKLSSNEIEIDFEDNIPF